MKPSTPANKRKSLGGDSIQKSNKKRKSSDSNVSTGESPSKGKTNGIESSPMTPTPSKKIKMFTGTSQLNPSEDGKPKTPSSPQLKKKIFKSPNASVTESSTDKSPKTGNDAKSSQKKDKKHKITKEFVENFGGKTKRSRNTFFRNLKDRVKSEEKKDSVISDIELKIATIEGRNALTKSAKRKLSYLKKMKRAVETGNIHWETDKNAERNSQKSKKSKKSKAKLQQKQQQQNKPKQMKKDTDDLAETNNEEAESDSEEGVMTSKVDQSAEVSDDEQEIEAEEDDESGNEEAGAQDDESENEEAEADEDESDSGEDDSDEDEPAEKVTKKNKQTAKNSNQAINKKENDTGSNKDTKRRFVLYVCNLPYDATEAEIKAHFSKAGKITSVRIPKSKENKPRGFAYIELTNEEDYQKAFSMHQTFIKGRQIKVQYTKEGNKNSDATKKVIKAENARLHTLRKEGKLAGSIKKNQKRSFRRKKAAQKSADA